MTLYEEVRAALRESDFRPRKRLGQNFLIHERVIDSILGLLDVRADDEVLEIGPGLGFLTRRLVEMAQRVYAVEVDDLLVERINASPLGAAARLRTFIG
jgi:16S rRNA (adenine1518-N6/adenine1519-N6)-dimethyltransferase